MKNSVCLVIATWLLLAGLPSTASASMRSEIHVFNTVTMSDQQLLRGKGGHQAGIVGALKLPQASDNPAVILLYGPGGYSYELQDWVELLNAQGIATFLVESTYGRVEAYTGMRQLAMIRDAWAALDVLANHPAIDMHRIALVGFTDAGQAALYSAMSRMQTLYGRADQQFAAVAAFYPNCGFQYRDDDQLLATPVRIFHGMNDNINAIGSCQDFARRAKANGADIQVVAYDDAGHGFDLQHPEGLAEENTTSFRDCIVKEVVKGVLVNETTGRMFRPENDCVQSDGRFAYNAAAAQAVKIELPLFLRRAFGQRQTAASE
ncbi:dienelactone hydrolase family protein [Oceanobacter kriegii]|uniref:dienelactone hydrolase family protein n=1 Tax=Oceanobacter kriegii TaxID=64972 RepID=UPI000400DD7B|nr:dienelactone hydrolase family protein [Oceanobacter kriegii]